MIVARRYVGGQGSKGVERSTMAPFNLLLHILLDQVHRNVARAFVHYLTALFPRPGSELSLDLQLS